MEWTRFLHASHVRSTAHVRPHLPRHLAGNLYIAGAASATAALTNRLLHSSTSYLPWAARRLEAGTGRHWQASKHTTASSSSLSNLLHHRPLAICSSLPAIHTSHTSVSKPVVLDSARAPREFRNPLRSSGKTACSRWESTALALFATHANARHPERRGPSYHFVI